MLNFFPSFGSGPASHVPVLVWSINGLPGYQPPHWLLCPRPYPVYQQITCLLATAIAPSTMSQILIITADGTFRPFPCSCRVHQRVACLPATGFDPLSLSSALPFLYLSGTSVCRLVTSNCDGTRRPCPRCGQVHQQFASLPETALGHMPVSLAPLSLSLSGPSAGPLGTSNYVGTLLVLVHLHQQLAGSQQPLCIHALETHPHLA